MTESVNYQAGLLINEITDLAGLVPEITGGGRGWKASIGTGLNATVAKGTGKVAALEALLEILQSDETDAPEEDESCNSAECQASVSPECSCRCRGAFHGTATAGRLKSLPVAVGNKPCACGCGEITQRRFVPGHDARYHTALKAAEAGLSVEDYRASLKTQANDRAAARRREQRAAAKAPVAKAESLEVAGDLPF